MDQIQLLDYIHYPAYNSTTYFELLFFFFMFITCSFLINNFMRIFQDIKDVGILKYSKTQTFRFAASYIPFVKNKLDKELAQFEVKMTKDYVGKLSDQTFELPKNGVSQAELEKKAKKWVDHDNKHIQSGKLSGALYLQQENDVDYIKGAEKFTSQFLYHNPLHFNVFNTIRQMETEVIIMTGKLFNCGQENYGFLTSGGTESITLAMLAYREWGRIVKGITNPEVVIPLSAHAAFVKAGFYLGMKVIEIPIDENTFEVNYDKMAKAITKNTVLIVGSVPNYPNGACEDIPRLGQMALKYNVGLHVDACLGGFLIPFAKECGVKIPEFDFKVDGVTSISCDHHKYGFAPKGSSIIMYKTKELRRYQVFNYFTWMGGCYGTPTLGGSKCGAQAAGAWYAMMNTGHQNYKSSAQYIFNAVQQVKEQLKSIPEIKLMGNPKVINQFNTKVCVVSVQSTSKDFNIYWLHTAMTKKEWEIAAIQNPAGLHLTITKGNAIKILSNFVKDIKLCISEIKQNPSLYTQGYCALYGTAQQIPDNGFLGEFVKRSYDCIYASNEIKS